MTAMGRELRRHVEEDEGYHEQAAAESVGGRRRVGQRDVAQSALPPLSSCCHPFHRAFSW